MLINQLSAYKADTVALQEIRWTGSGILEKRDCTLFYSCDNKGKLGTGFLVSKRIKHLITDFKSIAPRICTLRTRGKFFNYSFINGHAPTELSDDEEKDGFLDALERAYDTSPRNDIKIVLSDFKARVDKEPVNFHTTGNYSLRSLMNDNGSQLIQFAVSRNIIIESTFHPHKDIHKSTWRSPDGVTFNQTDHLLVERNINLT